MTHLLFVPSENYKKSSKPSLTLPTQPSKNWQRLSVLHGSDFRQVSYGAFRKTGDIALTTFTENPSFTERLHRLESDLYGHVFHLVSKCLQRDKLTERNIWGRIRTFPRSLPAAPCERSRGDSPGLWAPTALRQLKEGRKENTALLSLPGLGGFSSLLSK